MLERDVGQASQANLLTWLGLPAQQEPLHVELCTLLPTMAL